MFKVIKKEPKVAPRIDSNIGIIGCNFININIIIKHTIPIASTK
jgi:hypothetical protein